MTKQKTAEALFQIKGRLSLKTVNGSVSPTPKDVLNRHEIWIYTNVHSSNTGSYLCFMDAGFILAKEPSSIMTHKNIRILKKSNSLVMIVWISAFQSNK